MTLLKARGEVLVADQMRDNDGSSIVTMTKNRRFGSGDQAGQTFGKEFLGVNK